MSGSDLVVVLVGLVGFVGLGVAYGLHRLCRAHPSPVMDLFHGASYVMFLMAAFLVVAPFVT
jgi:hypothetical protein